MRIFKLNRRSNDEAASSGSDIIKDKKNMDRTKEDPALQYYPVPSLSFSTASQSSSNGGNGALRVNDAKTNTEEKNHLQSSLLDDTKDCTDDEADYDSDLSKEYANIPIKNIKDEVSSIQRRKKSKGISSVSTSFCDVLCNGDRKEVVNYCKETSDVCQREWQGMSMEAMYSKYGKRFNDQFIQARLFEDFTYLLGSESAPTNDERNIFGSAIDMFLWGSEKESSNGIMLEQPDLPKGIRNRAGESWRARAYRVRRLREEMMMGTKGNRSKTNNIIHSKNGDRKIKECKSMNDCDTESATSNSQQKESIDTTALEAITCNDLNITDENISDPTKIVLTGHDDLDLCYDSDPGERYERPKNCSSSVDVGKKTGSSLVPLKPNEHDTKFSRVRRSRNHLISRDHFDSSKEQDDPFSIPGDDLTFNTDVFDGVSTGYETDEDSFWRDENGKLHNVYGSQMPLIDIFSGQVSLVNLDDITNVDNNFIHQATQDTLNRTWMLTWHPTNNLLRDNSGIRSHSNSESSRNEMNRDISKRPNLSPRCVEVWFERGTRIRHEDIIEPKIMWRDCYHPDLASRRKLNLSSTQAPYQVCLLSICRLLKANEKIDRGKYPLAKSSCSLELKTCNNDEILFEAKSMEERDQVVQFWKLVVARLASQAVVGDGDGMVNEFFVPMTYGVNAG